GRRRTSSRPTARPRIPPPTTPTVSSLMPRSSRLVEEISIPPSRRLSASATAPPRQQGRRGGGQEPSGDVGSLGVCGATSWLRVRGGQVGAERDAADVVDAG